LTPALIENLSQRLNITPRKIHEKALQVLLQYSWPGNIRELENVLERSLILAEIDGAEILLDRHINISDEQLAVDHLPADQSLKSMLEEYEKQLLAKILKKYRFDVSGAAEQLKLDPSSLYRKLRKYGLGIKKEYTIN
jgi:transcriptional regulator with PAS, ATPase and Fis domain